MATFQKFNSFVEALAEKVHNLGSDQIVVALTNSAPSAANTVLANITQISYTNLSTRNVVTISSSQTGGVYTLVLTDLVLTASGAVPAVPVRRALQRYRHQRRADRLVRLRLLDLARRTARRSPSTSPPARSRCT
jgi:hypothetical protein